MTGSLLLRGGQVVDGTGSEPWRADVAVRDGRITAVGPDAAAEAGRDCVTLDCADRYVLPGLVDTHSHADAAIFDEDVQLALLTQGVTSVIVGQDGVSYAPGDGDYATEYFGGLNGAHPTYRGGGVRALLAGYDGTTPINVAYLVPAGTIRYEVLGRADRPATDSEIGTMRQMVDEGLAAGAVGLSTGLDYAPGRFAGTGEIAAIATPLATSGGVYVTHMRGGYEDEVASGVREVAEICRLAGEVPGHISHYHAPPALALAALEEGVADLTFDTYPYRAGCSLLAMPMLSPDLARLDPAEAVAALARPEVAARFESHWQPRPALSGLDADWADRLTIANPASTSYDWAAGLTLHSAAARTGRSVADFVIALLRASRLQATVIMPVPAGRTVDDLAALVRHPAHMGGSDGIYLGPQPHPRGWGTMARLLARHVRDRGDLSWGEAAWHLAGHPAERFALNRGVIRPGRIADLAVVDPELVLDRASYRRPRRAASGIADVIVAGQPVLRDGELTGLLPGRGLRRAAADGTTDV